MAHIGSTCSTGKPQGQPVTAMVALAIFVSVAIRKRSCSCHIKGLEDLFLGLKVQFLYVVLVVKSQMSSL